ncbi:unnamed protein product [Arctia plantaginis]|uniref:Uncharacterized protein n=1 Tax=Arctia plantaginis TaxID=874455 RepID=A0A8S1A7Q0_ARCPL|nr:unnamed protein product [Arctia plantaginis]
MTSVRSLVLVFVFLALVQSISSHWFGRPIFYPGYGGYPYPPPPFGYGGYPYPRLYGYPPPLPPPPPPPPIFFG